MANFVSPERDSLYDALRAQQRNTDIRDVSVYCTSHYHDIHPHLVLTQCPQVDEKTFQCTFYEMPCFEYENDDLPSEAFSLDEDTIGVYTGMLTVDMSDQTMDMGRFKTAHSGTVHLDNEAVLPPFTNAQVCVKQLYTSRGEGKKGISRLDGRYELSHFFDECNCIRWASILLDLTYKFIAREIEKKGQSPTPPIPRLRFTNTKIVIVNEANAKEKAFLIEEWIYTDEGDRQFVKYINNKDPKSILPLTAPANAFYIAEFLLFAQHVQWQKTNFAAFTSDYQGVGGVLTDPQITSNP
jgi:hypothetical protein